MSIVKDLTVVITNDNEGLTLTLKTVSAIGKNVVLITGDTGVQKIEEIEKALSEIKDFNREKEMDFIHVP